MQDIGHASRKYGLCFGNTILKKPKTTNTLQERLNFY
jgi:hypothetical protein